jgi:hypothetical protein
MLCFFQLEKATYFDGPTKQNIGWKLVTLTPGN